MLEYFAVTVVCMFGTFVFLCAVLKLRDARDGGKLQNAPKIIMTFAWFTLLIGLVLDTALNILLSPILLELPHEFLTTSRVSRLKIDGTDWQRNVSNWLCKQLDRLDNKHCGS